MRELERQVAHLVERVERRFIGKYRGLVHDNSDPEHLGRLRLIVPSVLGAEVVTGWALPCVPYGGGVGHGFLSVPEIGSGVWVEFEEGDLEFPIWVGSFWSKPDGETELPRGNDDEGAEIEEPQDPPSRKIIKTTKGHTIQIEDKDGEEKVLIVQIVDDENRNVVLMNADGIHLTDFTKNSVALTKDGVTITAKVPFKIDAAGQPVEIVADTIDLNKG